MSNSLSSTMCIAAYGLAAAAGCGAREDGAYTSRQRVVYGVDDRVLTSAYPDSGVRNLAANSVAALVHETSLQRGTDAWSIQGPKLGEFANLCDGEPFADLVMGAFCTGFLLDDRHVVTAGHCLVDRQACRDGFKLVFGYVGAEPQIPDANLFDCVAVDGFHHDPWDSERRLDYAVLRLDRAIAPPLTALTAGTVGGHRASDPLLSVGASQGVPMTADDQVFTLDEVRPESGFVTLTADLFHGSSGGPVLDADRNVIGLVSGGVDDYELDETLGCNRSRVASPTSDDFGERATLMTEALDDLCKQPHSACLPICSMATARPNECEAGPETSAGGGCCVGVTSDHASRLALLLYAGIVTAFRSRCRARRTKSAFASCPRELYVRLRAGPGRSRLRHEQRRSDVCKQATLGR
jgi:hypothetical protein